MKTVMQRIQKRLFAQEVSAFDTEKQVARYDLECGPVQTFKMSGSVMEQSPIAYVGEDGDVTLPN